MSLDVVLVTLDPQAPALAPLLGALTSLEYDLTIQCAAPPPAGMPSFKVVLLDAQHNPQLQEQLPLLRGHHTHLVALTPNSTHDRVTWLNLGADDALPYDIHPLELQARLRSVQRRHLNDLIYLGDLKLDPRRMKLWIGTQPIEMHEKEIALLRLLLQQPGRLHSSLELARTLDKGEEYAPAVEGRLKQVHQRVLQKTGQKLLITLPGKQGLLHMVDPNLSRTEEAKP